MMFGGLPVIIILITLGFGTAIGLLAFSLAPQQSDIAKRLKEAEEYDGSMSNRREAFAKIFNEKERGKLEQQLQEAGMYTVTPAQMGIRTVGGGLMGIMFGIGFTAVMGEITPLYIGVIVLLGAGGAYLPKSRMTQAIKKRKILIQKALPDFLDMLASTVQAGLAFNAALGHAMEVASGPLGEEIRAALSEVRLGRSRADALRSLSNRVRQESLSQVVTSIIQAEKLGSNMAQVLDELAEEVRNKRMSRAEELANLMPTKMVIPMALFMLPALFLMIFGGVIAQYMSTSH